MPTAYVEKPDIKKSTKTLPEKSNRTFSQEKVGKHFGTKIQTLTEHGKNTITLDGHQINLETFENGTLFFEYEDQYYEIIEEQKYLWVKETDTKNLKHIGIVLNNTVYKIQEETAHYTLFENNFILIGNTLYKNATPHTQVGDTDFTKGIFLDNPDAKGVGPHHFYSRLNNTLYSISEQKVIEKPSKILMNGGKYIALLHADKQIYPLKWEQANKEKNLANAMVTNKDTQGSIYHEYMLTFNELEHIPTMEKIIHLHKKEHIQENKETYLYPKLSWTWEEMSSEVFQHQWSFQIQRNLLYAYTKKKRSLRDILSVMREIDKQRFLTEASNNPTFPKTLLQKMHTVQKTNQGDIENIYANLLAPSLQQQDQSFSDEYLRSITNALREQDKGSTVSLVYILTSIPDLFQWKEYITSTKLWDRLSTEEQTKIIESINYKEDERFRYAVDQLYNRHQLQISASKKIPSQRFLPAPTWAQEGLRTLKYSKLAELLIPRLLQEACE